MSSRDHRHHRQQHHHNNHHHKREPELNYNDFRHGIDSLDTDYAQKRRTNRSRHRNGDSRSDGNSKSLSPYGSLSDDSRRREYSDDYYDDSRVGEGEGDVYDDRRGYGRRERRGSRRRGRDYSEDESGSYYDDRSDYDDDNDDYGDVDDDYYDDDEEEEDDEEDGDMSGDVKIIVPNRDVYDDFISHAGVMLAEFIASSIQSDIAIQRKATLSGNENGGGGGSGGDVSKSQSVMLEGAVKKFCSLLIDFPQSVSDGLRREFAVRLGDGYQTHSIVQQFMPALQYAASILRDHNDKYMHIPYNVSYGMGVGGGGTNTGHLLEYIVHRPDDYRSSLRYSSSMSSSSSSSADAISIELFIIDSLRRLVQTTLTSVSVRNGGAAQNSAQFNNQQGSNYQSSRSEPRVIHVDLFTSQNYSRLLESVKSSMRAVLTEYAGRYTFLAPVWWQQLDRPSSSIAANVASTKFLGASAQQARLSYMAHDRQQIAKDTRHDTHAIARSVRKLRHKMSRDRRSGRHSMENYQKSLKRWYKHQASRTIRKAADKAARSVHRQQQQQNDSSLFHPNNGVGGFGYGGGYYDRDGFYHHDDYDRRGRRSSRSSRSRRHGKHRHHRSRYDRNGRKIVYVYQNHQQQQQQSQNPNMSQSYNPTGQQVNNGDTSYNPGNGNNGAATYVGTDGNTYYCNNTQQQQVDTNGNVLWSPDDGHRRHRHHHRKHKHHKSSSKKKKSKTNKKKKKNNNRKKSTSRRRSSSSKSRRRDASSSSPSSSSYDSNASSSYFSSAGSYSNPSDSYYSSSVFTD